MFKVISDGKRTRGEGIGEPDGPTQGTGSPVILESRTMISSHDGAMNPNWILTMDPNDIRMVKPGGGAQDLNRMIVGVAIEDVSPENAVTVLTHGLIRVRIAVPPSTTVSRGHWIVPHADAGNEGNGHALAVVPGAGIVGPLLGYLLQNFTNANPTFPSSQNLWCYINI